MDKVLLLKDLVKKEGYLEEEFGKLKTVMNGKDKEKQKEEYDLKVGRQMDLSSDYILYLAELVTGIMNRADANLRTVVCNLGV